MELTVAQILQDMIVAEKYILSMYHQFGIDCSNMEFRTKLIEQYGEIAKLHFGIFQEMQKRDLYPTEPAEDKKINEAITMHTQMEKELKKILK